MFLPMLGLILSAIATANKLGSKQNVAFLCIFLFLESLQCFQGKHPLRTAELAWLVHENMCTNHILSAPEQETLL